MSWPTVKLGDIAPSRPLKLAPIENNEEVWLLNLDMVESQSGRIINKVVGAVDEAGSSTHWFSSEHVLYSKLRPYLNKVVLPDSHGLATTELVPMLPDPTRLDRRYLAHYLRSEKFVNWVSEQVAGAKMPRVSMKIFWDHEIPLPPLAEQKRIATILDKADVIRQKRKQAIDLADEFLRSVFLDMFGDPVTNPKGWGKHELSELAIKDKRAIVDGPFGASLKTDEYVSDGIPVIRINNIHDRKFVNDNFKYITENKFKELDRSSVSRNDLLIARVGHTIGKACVFNQDFKALLSTTGVCKVTCDENKISVKFLEALWANNSFQKYIKAFAKGAGQPYYNLTTIKGFEIITPPLVVQEQYVSVLNRVEVSNIGMMEARQELDTMFNALSQKAFSGEL
ncbi:restriction endonuclease subunit S [Vibrio sp. 10N.261.49.A12]|uniref:restriction endonuclease subunit S n=1 Tax=Vibrio sp. 10N.261.49.A12 TaxID=3229667 RepID=UPI003551BF4B